jgi:glutamate 5-kinase
VKRLVIKVGTSTLTGGGTGLDHGFIDSLARQIADQRRVGRQVVLVSSGAIQAGLGKLGWNKRPERMPQKQAAASVGQPVLMALYADIFAGYGIRVGQVLLTRDDLRSWKRYLNARNTFEALLAVGTLPIVNENDTVATDEIGVGDNDTLAARVASLLAADALLLLSDVDGLFDKNPAQYPDARLIERVERLDREIEEMAGPPGTPEGTGGMRTKLEAARIATGSGAAMWIARGRKPGVIADCLAHQAGAGTLFAPAPVHRRAHKRRLALADDPHGTIIVNARARRALEEAGRSLLPVGIVEVKGHWQAGDLVAVADETEDVFARGIACFAAGDVERIKGLPTSQLAAALDLPPEARPPDDEVIHRNKLVLC